MKVYSLRQTAPEETREELRAYPELLQHLLYFRGITRAEDAARFLSPDYEEHTHNPFLMKDMDKAVARILSAMRAKEKIIIFSDYDADGGPGGVILHDFFKKIGYAYFENYIPHRGNEGFGLNMEAIGEFALQNVKLIITIDCGIADAEEIAYAKTLGIETIITDHHEPPKSIPSAFAILNPKQKECGYPEKML